MTKQTQNSRLSLSRIPRDSLKYFEISVPRHFRFAELRKIIIRTATFNKYICNWTLKVRDISKILWKRGERSNVSSFQQYFFYYLLLDFHVQAGARFSLRDKRLFEISKVEIMRVSCICHPSLDWLLSNWYMNQHKNYLQKSYLLECPSLWFGWSVMSFWLVRELICV